MAHYKFFPREGNPKCPSTDEAGEDLDKVAREIYVHMYGEDEAKETEAQFKEARVKSWACTPWFYGVVEWGMMSLLAGGFHVEERHVEAMHRAIDKKPDEENERWKELFTWIWLERWWMPGWR